MGANCKNFGLLLSRYADAEVTDRERTAVDCHVGQCPACRQRLEGYRSVDQLLVMPALIAAEPYLWTRIRQQSVMPQVALRRVRPASVLARLRPVLIPIAGAALVVIGLVIGSQLSKTVTLASRQATVQAINPEPDESNLPANGLGSVMTPIPQPLPGENPEEDTLEPQE